MAHNYLVELIRNNGDIALKRAVENFDDAEYWAGQYGATGFQGGTLKKLIRGNTITMRCRDKRFREVRITIVPA